MGNLIEFKKWMHLHIGKLSDTSLKHRGSILLLSTLILFIDPAVKLTFGKASLAGLGISVDPVQVIPVGLFLWVLLIYRLTAFWVSVLLESGTDPKMAAQKALSVQNYPYEQNEPEVTMPRLLDSESKGILNKWTIRQMLWELVPPNLLALVALIVYLARWLST